MFVGTGRPRKPKERAAARELRQAGWSYKKIAAELGISPSSALNWTRDIELTPEQTRANLLDRHMTAEGILKRSEAKSRICRERRRVWQEHGREAADWNEVEHAAGCMLYWAEGSKDKNQLSFANSDVGMMQLFISFLRSIFDISDEEMTIRLNVYADSDERVREVEDYWLEALALPRSCLRRHQINHYPTSSSGKEISAPRGLHAPSCQKHLARPAHLRSNSAVRRLRRAALARLVGEVQAAAGRFGAFAADRARVRPELLPAPSSSRTALSTSVASSGASGSASGST